MAAKVRMIVGRPATRGSGRDAGLITIVKAIRDNRRAVAAILLKALAVAVAVAVVVAVAVAGAACRAAISSCSEGQLSAGRECNECLCGTRT